MENTELAKTGVWILLAEEGATFAMNVFRGMLIRVETYTDTFDDRYPCSIGVCFVPDNGITAKGEVVKLR